MLEQPITEPKVKAVRVDMNDASQSTESQRSNEPAAAPVLQVAKATDIRNPWACHECGAIIGSVYHEKVRAGMSISRLILFRGAVFIHETLPANFVFGKVDAGEFGCSRCGTVRVWKPTPEAIRYMMESGHRSVKRKNRNL